RTPAASASPATPPPGGRRPAIHPCAPPDRKRPAPVATKPAPRPAKARPIRLPRSLPALHLVGFLIILHPFQLARHVAFIMLGEQVGRDESTLPVKSALGNDARSLAEQVRRDPAEGRG